MSIVKRRVLTIFFILLFLVLAPMIIFYANGNILIDGWNILATGGISVRSMELGSKIFVNGKYKDTTSFFNRNYFLKNLRPGIYTVLVKKDGFNDWAKKIKVYANRVVESDVFMLPAKINTTEIKEFLEAESAIGTTTKKISQLNPNYITIKNLFKDSLILEKYISVLSTTTGKIIKYAPGTKENPIKSGRLSIWKEKGNIFMNWNGKIDSSPKIFCEEFDKDLKCKNQLTVYSFGSNVRSIDFFPDEPGVIIVSVENMVYAVEADDNSLKKPQILYSGINPDFRVFDSNTIYIKDGKFLGQIEI